MPSLSVNDIACSTPRSDSGKKRKASAGVAKVDERAATKTKKNTPKTRWARERKAKARAIVFEECKDSL